MSVVEQARTEPGTALLQAIAAEFPHFRIVPKQGNLLSRVIDVLLRVLTFGGQRSYMTRYHTVIGDTLYVPPGWDAMPQIDRAILLRHERVHLRQRRRYGTVGMALLYLLPFFPLGLAYGRARLEWEAYAETLRATAELKGPAAAKAPALRGHIVGRFCGADYGWMWPFSATVNRWYDEVLADLEQALPVVSQESSAQT